MSNADQNDAPRPVPKPAIPLAEPRTLDAQELFQGQNEICIRHAGVRYRLRITSRNRLILHR
ncbi:MAG: hemin uptake protein HemP [Gemmataceae bacterium]